MTIDTEYWSLRFQVFYMRWYCRYGFVRNLALVLLYDGLDWMMGRQWKTIHDGEWVKVRNLMNKHFKAARPCSVCRQFRCALVWYNIYTKEVRCFRCKER